MTIRWKLILTICMVLLINLAMGYYATTIYRNATNRAAEIRDNSFLIVAEGLSMQVHFKKQVQEWKNILLRSHEPGQLEKYFSQFAEEERIIQVKADHLLKMLERDTAAWQIVHQFLQSHMELESAYRDALRDFDPSKPRDWSRVDRQVLGIDREPTELVDRMVESILVFKEQSLSEVDQEIVSLEQRIYLVIGLLSVVTILIFSWLADHKIARPISDATLVARRISAGDLEGPIPARGSDEAGQLLHALEKMQQNLALSQGQLEEEREQLADRVKQRTEDLHVANLELSRLAKAKDLFLATMSHELRTPLTTMLGLTEMLRDELYGPLNQGQAKALSTIDESSRHLLTLINDILDLAKVESGKMELSWDYVPIQQVVEASFRLIQQPASQKRHKLDFTIDPLVRLVRGDSRRLKQMLVNLLGNAVKFTPEGGRIGLDISAQPEQEQVSFSVWDTGIGIDPEQQERLFQPFVQLDSEPTRRYSGTGLGLTLVRRMTELHSGSISVQSTQGRGSRFIVTLPWSPEDNTPAVADEDPLRAGPYEDEPRLSQAIKLLLAEDNPANREMISDYLNLRGFEVISTSHGAKVLQLLQEHHPAILLMDIQLEDMSGLEVTRKLRQLPGFERIPVIALTAMAMPGDREACLEAGMDDYLSKPIGLKEIHRRLMAHLRAA